MTQTTTYVDAVIDREENRSVQKQSKWKKKRFYLNAPVRGLVAGEQGKFVRYECPLFGKVHFGKVRIGVPALHQL